MKTNNPMGSPQSPSAQTGAQNGAAGGATPSARDTLAALFAQQDGPEVPADDASATASTEEAPETPEEPTAPEGTGENDLPAEETQEAEADAEATNDDTTEQTEGADGTDGADELAQLAAGLDETQRTQLTEMVKDVTAGRTTWGELKRGHKLLGEIEKLKADHAREVETLKSAGPGATGTGEAQTLPEALAKLQTVQEVRKAAGMAQATVDFVEGLLDTQPYDGDPEAPQYEVNGQKFSRKQLVEAKQEAKQRLRQLPERAEQIQRAQQHQQAKAQAREQIMRDFPVWNDTENPDVKTAQEFIRTSPQLAQLPNAEYVALAMARGHRALQAELAQRKLAKAKPKTAAPVKPGTVPKGKPHQPPGGAPVRPAAGLNAQAALEKHKQEGSTKSLAELIAVREA